MFENMTTAESLGGIVLIAFLGLMAIMALILIASDIKTRSYRYVSPFYDENGQPIPILPTDYSDLATPPKDAPVGTSIVHPREVPISKARQWRIANTDGNLPVIRIDTTDPRLRIPLGENIDSILDLTPVSVPPLRRPELSNAPTSPAPLQSPYAVTLDHLMMQARPQPIRRPSGAHATLTGEFPVITPKTDAQRAMANQWTAVRTEYVGRHSTDRRELVST